LWSTEFSIKRLDHVFTIDFEKTTEYDENKVTDNRNYRFVAKKTKLEDHIPSYELKSSVAELQSQLVLSEEKLNDKVNDLQSSLLVGLSIVFAGLTIVATLPYIAGSKLTLTPPDPLTAFYTTLAIVSLIISGFAFNRTRRPGKRTVLSKLAKLEILYQSKSITKEQFEKKKKKLLNRID